MRYEVIVTNQQPTCGGKSGTRSEIIYVETADPVSYVKEQAKGAELTVTNLDHGVIQIEYSTDIGEQVKYEFSED